MRVVGSDEKTDEHRSIVDVDIDIDIVIKGLGHVLATSYLILPRPLPRIARCTVSDYSKHTWSSDNIITFCFLNIA